MGHSLYDEWRWQYRHVRRAATSSQNFQRIRQGAPRCLTLSSYTMDANCAPGRSLMSKIALLSLQVFIDVLSRAFLNSCRDRDSSRYGASSPDGGTVALKHSPGSDKSNDAPPGESFVNQRDWSVVITVLDRVCFTFSVAAVVVAILICFPR